MAMSQSQAENAVVISALVTGGLYGYRYFTEGPSTSTGKESLAEKGYITKYKAFYGFGPVLPLHSWIPAAGITYLGLSILAAASPQVGGSASVLVGAGAFLGNAKAVFADVGKTTKPAAATTTATPTAAPGNHPPVSTLTGEHEQPEEK
jgi:hypothetical protein